MKTTLMIWDLFLPPPNPSQKKKRKKIKENLTLGLIFLCCVIRFFCPPLPSLPLLILNHFSQTQLDKIWDIKMDISAMKDAISAYRFIDAFYSFYSKRLIDR